MAPSRADVARTTILAVLLRDDVDPARAAQHLTSRRYHQGLRACTCV
jgi:hypothetical protein